jgi:hypothetical protein
MRSVTLALPALALLLAGCARLGFEDGLNLGVSLPASQADVSDLREWVDAQDTSIRADFAAADQAGQEAYEAAIASGLSEADARLAEADARAAAAARAADESSVRAREAAAKAEDGGGVDLSELLMTLAVVVAGAFGVNLHRNRTRAVALNGAANGALAAHRGRPAPEPPKAGA